MKKITISESIDFAKEIISNLTDEQLREVEGGEAANDTISCIIHTCNTVPTDEESSLE